MYKKVLSIFIFTFSSLFLQAQQDLKTVQAMRNDTSKVQAWINLSKEALKSNYDRYKSYADSAMLLAKKLKNEKWIAEAHQHLGSAYYYTSNLDEAIKHYDTALSYYEKTGDLAKAAKMLNNMGVAKRNQSRHDEGLEYLFRALEMKEKGTDTNSIAFTQKAIGETFAIQGNTERATFFFQKALKNYRAIKNSEMENSMLLNLGGFYSEQKKYDSALYYVLESKNYFEQRGPVNELARAWYVLGGIYLGKKDLVNSENAYHMSKLHFDSLNFTMRSIGCILRLAEIAVLKDEKNKAIGYAENAVALSRSIGTNEQILKGLNMLSDIYKSKADYKKALDYREQFNTLNDSINNIASKQKIAELEKKYETKLKEKELAELTATNELMQRRQRYRLYGFTGIVLIALVIVILLYNQYRIKKNSHDLLLEKNTVIEDSLQEKEILLREIHHRVKNNMQFISSLLSLQARHVKDEATLSILNDGRYRINSMALLHQKLYKEENLKGVEMRSYIDNLVESLLHAYKINTDDIEIAKSIDNLELDIDSATPIGLILNELVTNAFKHAFEPEKANKLHISLKEKNNILELCVGDNGKGLPPNFSIEESQQFGLSLVHSLAQKLKAEITTQSENGLEVKLIITKYKKA